MLLGQTQEMTRGSGNWVMRAMECSGKLMVRSALWFCPYLSVGCPGTTVMGTLEIPADLT